VILWGASGVGEGAGELRRGEKVGPADPPWVSALLFVHPQEPPARCCAPVLCLDTPFCTLACRPSTSHALHAPGSCRPDAARTLLNTPVSCCTCAACALLHAQMLSRPDAACALLHSQPAALSLK